ncbi:23S rRNA (guanosine(2251)-2'-O)-methyltransferase RlmB [bacterium]|nr:23S rRNA (guanosine(2251)-2'-O)-methyltransferase RlmB [bacterium]
MREKNSVRKIHGRRAVLEALRSKDAKIEKVFLAKGTHGTVLQELQNQAESRDIPVEWLERRRLDRLAGPVVNQGVLAVIKTHVYAELSAVMDKALSAGPASLLIITDEIEDPRNLGAIIRSAECAGAQGLLMTIQRSTDVTSVTEKAAGGALAHLPVAKVGNLANTIKQLKNEGFWVIGLAGDAPESIWQADLKRPVALVIGNEGKGLRRLTRELCDMLIKIPMQGNVGSLNASVAAGVALFEIQRQRQN